MEKIFEIINSFEKFISNQYITSNSNTNILYFIDDLNKKIQNDILKKDVLIRDDFSYAIQDKICDLNNEIEDNICKKKCLERKLEFMDLRLLRLKICGNLENKINFILDSEYEDQLFSDEMWCEINKRIINIDYFTNEQNRLFIIEYNLNNENKIYSFMYYDFPKNKNIEIRTKCPHNNELEIIQSKHIWLLPEDSVWQYENKRYFNLKKLIQECILK